MSDGSYNAARLLVATSAAEALGLSVEEVNMMTLRAFIDRATEKGLNVDVHLRQSRLFSGGGLTVTYKPDRAEAPTLKQLAGE